MDMKTQALIEALKSSLFALDSVFHLTGNKVMLPYIEEARDALKAYSKCAS